MKENNLYNWTACVKCITYNHAPYITEAMNGFCMQDTSFPYVCVIIDDASTDNEQEIIKQYLHENFDLEDRTIVRKEETDDYYLIFSRHKLNFNCFFAAFLLKYNHHSCSKSKMKYLEEWLENTKYVAICEGDDYWTNPHKLQSQFSFLESHEEYVLAYTNALIVDSTSTIISTREVKRYNGNCLRALIEKGNFVVTAGVFYRNDADSDWIEVYKNIPFPLMLSDKPHWLFLATKGLFCYNPQKMTAYRYLKESASHHVDYDKAMAYSDNIRDIDLYFNDMYNIGVSKSVILKRAVLHRILSSIKFGNKKFVHEVYIGLKTYPSLLFKVNFWKLIVKRIIYICKGS